MKYRPENTPPESLRARDETELCATQHARPAKSINDMHWLKQLGVRTIATTGVQRLFMTPFESQVTSLLFHRFFGPGESVSCGRERIRKMCGWLSQKFTVLNADQFADCLPTQEFPERTLLITIDDAHKEVLDVIDVFQEFGISPVVFVPLGWIDSASSQQPEPTLAAMVTLLEHSDDCHWKLEFSNGVCVDLKSQGRLSGIDTIVELCANSDGFTAELRNQLTEFDAKSPDLTSEFCTWHELQSLHQMGVSMGSHSVSHCRMAGHSAGRLRYEFEESRRVLIQRFGTCRLFAYPYGTRDVHDAHTEKLLHAAGYDNAFLVHAGFGLNGNRFALPRVDIPDLELNNRLFRALSVGAQIPLIHSKNVFRKEHRRHPKSDQ